MIRGQSAMDLLSQPIAEKLVKNQEQINQLHETLSAIRIDKQNALVRRLVKKQQDGTLGQPTSEAAGAEEAMMDDVEDGKVSFGDTTTYNISEVAKEMVVPTKAPNFLPYLLAAALGGTGLGAAAMAVPALLKAAPAVTTSSADTDTTLNLEFKEEPAP